MSPKSAPRKKQRANLAELTDSHMAPDNLILEPCHTQALCLMVQCYVSQNPVGLKGPALARAQSPGGQHGQEILQTLGDHHRQLRILRE